MSDLLPHNATAQERALAGATARVGAVPVVVREMWDPDTCPADLLPWLAWALSVDVWDPTWTNTQKRAAIRTAIAVQQRKGTIGAVRDALGAVGLPARVLEWHRAQVIGNPYTYKLQIEVEGGAELVSPEAVADAIAAVDRTKSLRSHLEAVEVTTSSEADLVNAAFVAMGHELVVSDLAPGRNLIAGSEDFTTWTPVAAGTGIVPTVTPDAGGSPVGTSNASRVEFDLNGGTTSGDRSDLRYNPFVSTPGEPYCFSIWIKSFDGASYDVQLNLNGSWNPPPPSVQTVTGEWQRFFVKDNAASDDNRDPTIRIRGAQGTSGTADLLIWGAQLEVGSAPTEYERTDP